MKYQLYIDKIAYWIDKRFITGEALKKIANISSSNCILYAKVRGKLVEVKDDDTIDLVNNIQKRFYSMLRDRILREGI